MVYQQNNPPALHENISPGTCACRLFITVPVEVFIALACLHLRAKNSSSPITGLYDNRDSKKGCQGLAQRHGRESLMSCLELWRTAEYSKVS